MQLHHRTRAATRLRDRLGELLIVFSTFALFVSLLTAPASAHPLSQGSLDVTVYRDHVLVRARVTEEEVSVTNMLAPAATTPASQLAGKDAQSASMYAQHAGYLVTHLHLSTSGTPLAGSITRIAPDPVASSATQNLRVTYEFDYRPPAGWSGNPIASVRLSQNVLTDVQFLPGITWEASYVVRIAQENRTGMEGLLLKSNQPIDFACDWREAEASSGSIVNRGRLFREYVVHGIHHILTGYDHLLFISALVLAATSFWDLVKVVSAFTLAHTITLTLAALNIVHLSERIVEPLISASIVFVAVQNVFWPSRSRGWTRLAAAFFFGLFHGLGFAGGLLEAMQGMTGLSIVLAIAAFSLGVELGHQMVVLPLFACLKLARHTRETPMAKEALSLFMQRLGSAGITLAGIYYLCIALKPSLMSGAG